MIADQPLDRAHMKLRELRADADMLSMVIEGKQVDALLPETLRTVAHRMVAQCGDLQAALDEVASGGAT